MQSHQYPSRMLRLLSLCKDWCTLFPSFGKYAGNTQCEAFNWTLGIRPISPKTRLLVSLSKTVNKPLTWHLQIEEANLPLADTEWGIVCTLDQYGNQCILYDFLTSCHGNRCPYRHTDHLGTDEKLSWVDTLCSCLLQQATCVFMCLFQVGEFHHKLYLNSAGAYGLLPEMWLVLFLTCDCKWKTDKIPARKLPTFMCNSPLSVAL